MSLQLGGGGHCAQGRGAASPATLSVPRREWGTAPAHQPSHSAHSPFWRCCGPGLLPGGCPGALISVIQGAGHMRRAEAFDPCGRCAKPRLGHLRWPGAEAVAPSVRPAEPSIPLSLPAGRVCVCGGGLPGGRLPKEGTRFCPGRVLIPRRPFRTRDKLSPQKRGGVAAALDSISYSQKQR